MHEIGVAGEIIKTTGRIARENGAESPKTVGLTIGTLSGVEPNSLSFALDAIKDDMGFGNTVFEITVVKAKGICAECGKCSEPDAFFSLCPHCGSPALELVDGTEFKVDYIDI